MEKEWDDHSLLVRIDERLQQWILRVDADLMASNTRHTTHDEDIKSLRVDVNMLIRAKVQIYAVAATSSCLVSLLIKVFWK
jgi:hypothetical protein